jgi:hypothetical protein
MATSSASIEERWITPQTAATFLRRRLISKIEYHRGAQSAGVRMLPGHHSFSDFRACPFAKYIFDWAVPLRVD